MDWQSVGPWMGSRAEVGRVELEEEFTGISDPDPQGLVMESDHDLIARGASKFGLNCAVGSAREGPLSVGGGSEVP